MTALRPLQTSAGKFQVRLSQKGIAGILLPGKNKKKKMKSAGAAPKGAIESIERSPLTFRQKKIFGDLSSQFKNYFSGSPYSFKKIPVDLSFCTPFQKKVLLACCRIPAGRTLSYGELAAKIGRRRASRAVGSALGSNCVPILIPCHRVVRSDGGLGGFTAGTAWKKRLLQVEGESPSKVKS